MNITDQSYKSQRKKNVAELVDATSSEVFLIVFCNC